MSAGKLQPARIRQWPALGFLKTRFLRFKKKLLKPQKPNLGF